MRLAVQNRDEPKRNPTGRVLAGIGFALVLLAALASCERKQASQSATVTVGAISPFTGDGAQYGHLARTGIDLAVAEINANGGINGRTLKVQYEDDRGNQNDAVAAFNKLVSVDKVPAVLGPFYSGNVLACAAVANRTKTVLITGSATSDNITNAGSFVYRVCPTNLEQARTAARFAREQLKLDSAFIIYRNADYGVTLRDAFQSSFTSMGGTILGVEAIAPDAPDARAQLAKVAAARPQLIFAAVHFPEGGAVLRQSKELQLTATVITTDGSHDPKLMEIAGDAAEGSYSVTMGWGDESRPQLAAFRAAFKATYGEDPGVYSGLFYDATQVLALSMKSASDQSGDTIRAAMSSVKYDGVTGVTAFDENGDVSKPFTLYRVEGGQFVPVRK